MSEISNSASDKKIGWICYCAAVTMQTLACIIGKICSDNISPNWQVDLNAIIYYLISLICLFVQTVFWLKTLKYFDLSFIYPLMSVSSIIILIISYSCFNEIITFNDIAGTVVVLLGIYLLTS